MNRAPVKRNSFQKRNEPPVKVIHIRRSEDVQLHKTEQAWKPAQINKDDEADPEAIKTAVRTVDPFTLNRFFVFIVLMWSSRISLVEL